MESKQCNNCGRTFRNSDDFLKETERWRMSAGGHLWFNCACGSTLMLPKGKYPWYSPVLGLSEEAASLFNLLAVNKMPQPPTAVMRLMQMVESPDSSASDLERALRDAPALALNVMKMANSALASKRNPVRTLEGAIVGLGRTHLKELILAAPLQEISFPTAVYSREIFWQEARQIAQTASELALRTGYSHAADEAFLAGFLVDIGKIIQALWFPAACDAIFVRVKSPEVPCTWCEAETLEQAPSHEVLGEIAAAMWGLPDYVRCAASFHHREPMGIRERDDVSDLAGLAVQIFHWNADEPGRVDLASFRRLCARFQLSDKSVFSLMLEIAEEVRRHSRGEENPGHSAATR